VNDSTEGTDRATKANTSLQFHEILCSHRNPQIHSLKRQIPLANLPENCIRPLILAAETLENLSQWKPHLSTSRPLSLSLAFINAQRSFSLSLDSVAVRQPFSGVTLGLPVRRSLRRWTSLPPSHRFVRDFFSSLSDLSTLTVKRSEERRRRKKEMKISFILRFLFFFHFTSFPFLFFFLFLFFHLKFSQSNKIEHQPSDLHTSSNNDCSISG
jgi:hypothetical protein